MVIITAAILLAGVISVVIVDRHVQRTSLASAYDSTRVAHRTLVHAGTLTTLPTAHQGASTSKQ